MTNQQLKAHCEDVIANPQDHLDWVVDMARVALASLEAEPTYARLFGHYGYGDRCWLECGKSEEGAQPFYTAPPSPELKLPGVSELIAISDCTPSVSDVLLWDACVAEFKRLNGVTS